jgi:hypothetical protein
MSFRGRLTIFLVALVVVPIAATGVLMFRLINDREQGEADARASDVSVTAGQRLSESGCHRAGGR